MSYEKVKFLGIEYGRGGLRVARDGMAGLAPAAVQKMFPDADWTMVTSDPFDPVFCERDRFGENYEIQKRIYATTRELATLSSVPGANIANIPRHIMIGGDHSVNFGHFSALADMAGDTDLCLIYIDAHTDIHTPETAVMEASGAPHGTNVRALMGSGDFRWLTLQQKRPALHPENMFYLGIRSYEPAEAHFVMHSAIFNRASHTLQTPEGVAKAIDKVKRRLNGRPYVLSFDFDSLDPTVFSEVGVPAYSGISAETAESFVSAFAPDALAIEFVEWVPHGDEKSAAIVKNLVGIAADAMNK